ncbi:ABC transporter substrate-binding protein [Variovorax defluvii]|uniref:ABC transporter substrate-binding protein n=1 Tax=Variovorax defluvii TaxID=913761 RepID=A0ABP8GWL6_9BURK
MKRNALSLAAAAALAWSAQGAPAQSIFIGILDDVTGATSQVGRELADAKADTIRWINANGGVNGKKIEFEAVDYAYKAPAAIASYKKWMSQPVKPIAIYGYGTADTEALSGFVNADKVVYLSHSFSALLSDPTGASKRVEKPTPYNFYHGATYSDGCRAGVKHFMDQWKREGMAGKPKFAFMGDNHPFANSPKDACIAYANELGYEVIAPIQYSMRPGDFKAQCLTLKESGAQVAYMGNTGDSNVSLMKSCSTVGVAAKFYSNAWGYSEQVMDAVGPAGAGAIAPFAATPWNMSDGPGAKTVSEISGGKPRTAYYAAAVCSLMYLREALAWADTNGGIKPENVTRGMYQKKDWVPKGMEGVCAPATWTETDHRSVSTVALWEGLIKDGKATWKKAGDVQLGRDAKWFAR